MKRTKPPKQNLVKILDPIIQPNIWLLKDSVDGVERRVIRFTHGEKGCKAILRGRVFQKDFEPWVTMLDMIRRNNGEPYDSDDLLVDIARAMGYRINPWQKVDDLWDTFDRLLEGELRIKPEQGRGLTAKFTLLEGWIDTGGKQGSFHTSKYHEIVQTLLLGGAGETSIDRQMLRGTTGMWRAQAIYKHLARTQLFYKYQPYPIRLSKLCEAINFDTTGLAWWEVWREIERAINKLKELNYVSEKTVRDTKRYKQEGGVVTFYRAMKKLKDKPEELSAKKSPTNDVMNEYIEVVREILGERMQDDDTRYRTALHKLVDILDRYSDTNKYILRCYSEWLNDKKEVREIKAALFYPENVFFKSYIAKELADGNLLTWKEQEQEDSRKEEFQNYYEKGRDHGYTTDEDPDED